jgi:acetylornithine deacetylase/succinyl-diaminopimelate desuccinylase-like protein
MNDPIEYLRQNRERHQQELIDFVAIPSVSAKSEHRADMIEAAEWIRDRLADAGAKSTEIVPTGGHPVILAEVHAREDAPTLLVYGHYDVQPPEPLEEWTSPPFAPEIREGRLYGRGSADDKGQLYIYVKALEAHVAARGRLPVNLKFLIEGEEEVGSTHLDEFLTSNRERLRCDAVLISDTGMFAPGLPSITVGLRGMAYLEIRVRGPRGDLHSGAYGGAVVNPATALTRIIAQLHDEEGRVTVPGFYDDVLELTDVDRRRIAALPHDDDNLRGEVGAIELGGESGFSTLERIWVRPALDVNGLLAGYTGEGAKTVLPARAMAKVSMRLVPKQRYRDIEKMFIQHVRSLAPRGVEVEVVALHGGEPWHADPEHPIFDRAEAALESAFGAPPVYIREGGSIPIVRSFEETLGVPVVLMGFALPGSNIHAPNEWFSMENFARGAEAIVKLFDEVGMMDSI